MISLDVDLIDFYDRADSRNWICIWNSSAKLDDPDTFFRLQSIPGVGRILAMTMLYEIHDIGRFPTVGQFLSYSPTGERARTPPPVRHYKPTGSKIGNPHLKWAF